LIRDPRRPLETSRSKCYVSYPTPRADGDDACDGLLVGRCTYQICPTIYGSLSWL